MIIYLRVYIDRKRISMHARAYMFTLLSWKRNHTKPLTR